LTSIIDVKVPDIGDFKDVPIIEISVKPGDIVKLDDPLITLESDCSAAIARYAGSSLEWSGCRADRFRSRSEVCSGPQSSSGPQSFRRPVGSARSWRRFLCTARACPDNAPAGRSYFSSDFGKCQRSRTRPRHAGDLACGRTPGDVSQSLI